MDSENKNFKVYLMASTLRALWGEIYPSVVGIIIGYNKDSLKAIMYLDRESNSDDIDNLNTITGEICADFPFIINCVEHCEKYEGGSFDEIYCSEFGVIEHFVAYRRKEHKN
jgi:hypothetical protein